MSRAPAVLDTLGEDYIRTARAKGLPEVKVLMRHALANAAVPIVTVIGIGIALLIGGVVVTDRSTPSRTGAADGGRRAGARLPHHPGRDPAVQLRLRDDQPAGRPVLRVLRPAHPLLMMQPANFEALSVEAATIVKQLSAWQRVRRNWSVRLGGIALLVLLLVALAAPWLGTVDPSLFDPASRDLLPGQTGEITTLEGETLEHRFIMGSDSFGRDIYSRVIYGTRVSLIVGAGHGRGGAGLRHRCWGCGGFLRWLDGPLMRVMDGVMAIPAILIAIALVAHVARQPAHRGGRHRHPRDPARDAAGALAGADDTRRALCRSGDLAGHAHGWIMLAPHPAQHRGAADGAGHLHLRIGHPGRGHPVLPGRGPAARHPHLGQRDGRRPRAVQLVPAQHLLSRHLPGGDGAGGQHPGRRSARHARPEDGEAGMNAVSAPILEVQDLTIALPKGGDRATAVQKVSLHRRPRRDRLPGRRIGLRQERHRAGRDGPAAQAAAGDGGRILLQGEDITHAPLSRLRELRGHAMWMIFQEPMTALNPVMTCGDQIDEVLSAHTKLAPPSAAQGARDHRGGACCPTPSA